MIANLITAARILLLAPLYYCLAVSMDLRWLALGIFLLAGLTDILDGYLARRLGQASAFGAMLDLIADRLLILVTATALIASGSLSGPSVIPAIVLMARCVIVASLNESLPGRLHITVSNLEKIKILFHFVGFILLIAPPIWHAQGVLAQPLLGAIFLTVSAALVCVTLADYSRRALTVFSQPTPGPVNAKGTT